MLNISAACREKIKTSNLTFPLNLPLSKEKEPIQLNSNLLIFNALSSNIAIFNSPNPKIHFFNKTSEPMALGSIVSPPIIVVPQAEDSQIVNLDKAMQFAFKKAMKYMRTHFPHINVLGLEKPERINTSSLQGSTNVGVMDNDIEGFLMALCGSRNHPDANFMIVPHVPENLFMRGSRMFARAGLIMDWKDENTIEVRFGKFSSPVEIHSYFTFDGFSHEVERKVIQNGIPTINFSSVHRLAGNKLTTQQFFKKQAVLSPRYAEIQRNRFATPGEIRTLVETFIENCGVESFVIKPLHGSQGRGIRMFKRSEMEEAVDFIAKSFKKYNSLLVEERIISRPMYIKGKRYDWNFRVIVPLDNTDEWNVEDSSEIRYDVFSGKPVNKSVSAKIMELREAFKLLGLTPEETEQLLNRLKTVAIEIKNKFKQELIERNGGVDLLDKNGNSHFGSTILGLDLLLDENNQIYCYEVNSGHVGGIDSLADLREKEGKLKAVEAIARDLYKIGQASASLAGRFTEPIESLDSAENWLQLAYLHHDNEDHESAINYYKRVLEENPNHFEALLNLGRIYYRENYEQTIKYLSKALEVAPTDSRKTWILLKIACIYGYMEEYFPKMDIHYSPEFRFKKAMEYLALILEENPEDSDIYYEIGRLYYQYKNYDEAEKYFLKAIELDPDNLYALRALGNYYYFISNDISLAIKYLEDYCEKCIAKGKKLNNKYKSEYLAVTLLTLGGLYTGILYRKYRDLDKAIYYFEKALTYKPEGELLKDIKKFLKLAKEEKIFYNKICNTPRETKVSEAPKYRPHSYPRKEVEPAKKEQPFQDIINIFGHMTHRLIRENKYTPEALWENYHKTKGDYGKLLDICIILVCGSKEDTRKAFDIFKEEWQKHFEKHGKGLFFLQMYNILFNYQDIQSFKAMQEMIKYGVRENIFYLIPEIKKLLIDFAGDDAIEEFKDFLNLLGPAGEKASSRIDGIFK